MSYIVAANNRGHLIHFGPFDTEAHAHTWAAATWYTYTITTQTENIHLHTPLDIGHHLP